MFRKLISDFLEGVRYDGVPAPVPYKKQPRSPTQVGFLGANQVKWLDERVAGFKLCREQAEASRGVKS